MFSKAEVRIYRYYRYYLFKRRFYKVGTRERKIIIWTEYHLIGMVVGEDKGMKSVRTTIILALLPSCTWEITLHHRREGWRVSNFSVPSVLHREVEYEILLQTEVIRIYRRKDSEEASAEG